MLFHWIICIPLSSSSLNICWNCSLWVGPCCYCSVIRLCLTFCNPMDCSMSGFPVLHHLLELAQTCVHWVSDAIQHLIHCCFLLLLPSVFPNIRAISSESVLCIRWPKYWSFSLIPSNEYSGLISFRIDWFDLFAAQGTLRVFFNITINSLALSLLYGPTLTPIHDYWKNNSFDYTDFVGKVMFLLLNMLSLS